MEPFQRQGATYQAETQSMIVLRQRLLAFAHYIILEDVIELERAYGRKIASAASQCGMHVCAHIVRARRHANHTVRNHHIRLTGSPWSVRALGSHAFSLRQ